MSRRPPRSTRTDTCCPDTPRFRAAPEPRADAALAGEDADHRALQVGVRLQAIVRQVVLVGDALAAAPDEGVAGELRVQGRDDHGEAQDAEADLAKLTGEALDQLGRGGGLPGLAQQPARDRTSTRLTSSH